MKHASLPPAKRGNERPAASAGTDHPDIGKPRSFYTNSETIAGLFRELTGAVGCDRSPDELERYLQSCKAEYIRDGEPDPEMWDKQRMFRVTVQEIARGTANAKPKSRKRAPEVKAK